MKNIPLLMSIALLALEITYSVINWHSFQSRDIEAQIYALIASSALVANLFCFGKQSPPEQKGLAMMMRVIFVCVSVGYQVHNIFQSKVG